MVSMFPQIFPPSTEAFEGAKARQLTLTKPAGSLGRLEEIGNFIASCQGTSTPTPISQPRIVVFAGDHGVAQAGVSAYPAEVSLQMAANINAGGAAINVLANQAGAEVVLADISLNHGEVTVPSEVGPYFVRSGSGRIDIEDAMSLEEFDRALAIGRGLADKAVDEGCDLLIAGDLGIGNTTPAAALIGAACGLEPVVAVGRGTGIDDEGWKRKVSVIRDAMFRVRTLRNDPAAVLRAISSPDLVAMAGFLAQASVCATPVILDGVVVTAAALWANQLAPGASAWWLAGHRSAEPAHTRALEALNLTPLVDNYSMRLGEGSGAALALPLVKAATAILSEMATFDSAGVSTKSED
ncbi:MAG: nicotinate-nucleotide--dimethylbenzimidazole phosphoribosyltransferase [Corynebacterium sp.]|nr:nicotinate-nucleotide--dimethylbenzimidazole phosphoribosyltransferase [Corynebacterium sp.]